ncbi:MAG: exosortase/archaeosortase family protein [Phycisphaerae bacterium]|nr:exosortase/archaeosortase family protein [Phycisphaerae bacterium]
MTKPARRRRRIEEPAPGAIFTPFALAVGAVLLIALMWSYWPALRPLIREWQVDQNYSVGLLVPFAALWLLWHDRRKFQAVTIRPAWVGGIALILVAQLARAYGLLFLFESAERYSLVLSLAGLVLLVAGRQAFWRARWILLFLFLMVPLPGKIHNLISGPLQSYATAGAVFLLELFGMSVARDGNIITLNGSTELAVAEACSGLRMLTAFVVVAAVLAYFVNRPPWQKAVLVVSSVPIAIACNIIRLVITAELYLLTSSEVAEKFFHDFAGLTMMPMAVLMLVGLLILLDRLVIEDQRAASGTVPDRVES